MEIFWKHWAFSSAFLALKKALCAYFESTEEPSHCASFQMIISVAYFTKHLPLTLATSDRTNPADLSQMHARVMWHAGPHDCASARPSASSLLIRS